VNSFKQKNEAFKKETIRIFQKAAASAINLNAEGFYIKRLIRFLKKEKDGYDGGGNVVISENI
jgi:phosphoribosylaminoimidazole carboxylase (NCAIR synthetase)